ncbi:hypothetical protein CDAR_458301 [Caerostris darwini]|uniref:Uncharacterized protein n=1 Tax=Caerostris darwini TaxID=1538125 RepID=A0AAV4TI33_9ARAC|nr:hypothetical protein CDAR_458301 [Caerostris darwini]
MSRNSESLSSLGPRIIPLKQKRQLKINYRQSCIQLSEVVTIDDDLASTCLAVWGTQPRFGNMSYSDLEASTALSVTRILK